MTVTSTRPPVVDPGARPGFGASRPVRPRRGLPGSRAVVGGLLVALAAVGTVAAATGAGRGPDTQALVAARDLAPGSVLGPADVELVVIDLPHHLRGRTFTSPDQVQGAVTVGPLAAGELVQAGGVADGVAGAVPTFSLSLPAAAANGGHLRAGDTVQVLATYGTDTAATTRLLAPEARVVAVDRGDDTLGVADEVALILAVPSPEERSRVINATTSGTVTLVRTTGAADPGGVPTYRPEPVGVPDGDDAGDR